MSWATLVHTDGVTPQILREDELRQLFKIPPPEEGKPDLIPFIQMFFVQSNTASRSLITEIDPDRPRGENDTDPIVVPTAQGQYANNQIQFAQPTADLSFRPIPIQLPVKASMTLQSSGSGIWTISIQYVLVEGNFLPRTEILERLADRRKMDMFDDDTEGESYFRMGQRLQMGDADPGT